MIVTELITPHPCGSQAYLDYARAMARLPQLRERLDDKRTSPDATGAELEELTRSVPKLIGILAESSRDSLDIRHKAALAVMMSGLASRMDQVRPLAVRLKVSSVDSPDHTDVSHLHSCARRSPSQLGTQLRTASVPESTKLHHIRATAYENFLRTIEVA